MYCIHSLPRVLVSDHVLDLVFPQLPPRKLTRDASADLPFPNSGLTTCRHLSSHKAKISLAPTQANKQRNRIYISNPSNPPPSHHSFMCRRKSQTRPSSSQTPEEETPCSVAVGLPTCTRLYKISSASSFRDTEGSRPRNSQFCLSQSPTSKFPPFRFAIAAHWLN